MPEDQLFGKVQKQAWQKNDKTFLLQNSWPHSTVFMLSFQADGAGQTVDPDQMPHNAASDQDLYYLPLTQQFSDTPTGTTNGVGFFFSFRISIWFEGKVSKYFG